MKKIFLLAFFINFSFSFYSQSKTHYINGYTFRFEAVNYDGYYEIYREGEYLMSHPLNNYEIYPSQVGSYSISRNIITFKTIYEYDWGSEIRIQKYRVSNNGSCKSFFDETYDY